MRTSPLVSRIKSILLLAGAFAFAFLLGEAVHELGHYLAHRAYGHTGIGIHLDPFGGSRIAGVRALPRAAMAWTSAAGPLANLACGVACSLLLWRVRRLGLLPWTLWGPVAMVQEGVSLSLGFLTPGGDARWVAAAGVPAAVLIAAGIGLLLAGAAAMSLALTPAVLRREDTLGVRFLIVASGASALMGVRAAHALLAAPVSATENLVPLVFSLLLAALVACAQAPLRAILRKDRTATSPPSWRPVALALGLGTGMVVLQLAASHLA